MSLGVQAPDFHRRLPPQDSFFQGAQIGQGSPGRHRKDSEGLGLGKGYGLNRKSVEENPPMVKSVII